MNTELGDEHGPSFSPLNRFRTFSTKSTKGIILFTWIPNRVWNDGNQEYNTPMTKDHITKSITIKAPVKTVWRVFTDPVLTSKMGGKYVTDWKVGSDFGWMGNDGVMYTRGALLAIKKHELIEHDLFDAEDTGEVTSVITYKFTAQGNNTILTGTEGQTEDLDEEEYADAVAGWDEALKAVKEIAESV